MKTSSILFAVLAWSLLILRFGYRFGTGDQVELLPYTIYLHNPSLYIHDFFIQGLNASVPNERTVMAHILLPFQKYLEVICLLLQFGSTVFLILGLEKLAIRFIHNRYWSWLAILLALIVLNDFTLGNVDLYSECFQASGMAVALVIWAIHWFLNKKYLQSSILFSVATFIQLLEGLDVMMVMSLLLLWSVWKGETTLKTWVGFVTIYAFTAGIYLVAILIQKSASADISNHELFSILFQFRHPHHFIFSSFPLKKTLVFSALGITSVWYFSSRSTTIFRFLIISLTGLVIYIIAVDVFHLVFIGNFQFYKLTQWIKFLGVVAVAALLSGLFRLAALQFEKSCITIATICVWIFIIVFHRTLPYQVPFQLFDMKKEDELISICQEVQCQTPIDAVFIQPFENTELKFYGQRSSYVEFKANVRNRRFVGEWYHRLKQVYQIDTQTEVKGFELQTLANNHFYHLTADELIKLKAAGVTHVLTRKEFPMASGAIIISNNSYAVYQL